MLTLTTTLALLLWLAGCASQTGKSTGAIPKHTDLGVPLESEEGQVKIAALEYLSETILKDSTRVRLVPLPETDIQKVRHRFSHELRPAARGGFLKSEGACDKITGEPVVLLGVGKVRIQGNSAKVYAGYSRFGSVIYRLGLVKENGRWRVGDATLDGVADVAP